VRFEPSFATRASPLCRFPFRLHRVLNLQNSAEADWLAQCRRECDVLPLALAVWASLTRVNTSPAADRCCRISVNSSAFRHESATCSRSPAISSTACDTRPPDLAPASLMDTNFAIVCSPVRRRGPPIQFLSIGPHPCCFLQTSPHGDALALRYPSPPSGWDGTFTGWLPNMRGVPQRPHPQNQWAVSCRALLGEEGNHIRNTRSEDLPLQRRFVHAIYCGALAVSPAWRVRVQSLARSVGVHS
jgi:hypothetical protein